MMLRSVRIFSGHHCRRSKNFNVIVVDIMRSMSLKTGRTLMVISIEIIILPLGNV